MRLGMARPASAGAASIVGLAATFVTWLAFLRAPLVEAQFFATYRNGRRMMSMMGGGKGGGKGGMMGMGGTFKWRLVESPAPTR
jgi:hypothetical protein